MALVLTRRPGQKLILDRPHIEILVDRVNGKNVRLVIVAPQNVSVMRDELLLRPQPVDIVVESSSENHS